jgi:putative lipoic acid-binding regulatory protein
MSEENKKKPVSEEQKVAFYQRLKDELEKNDKWPVKYMYKFIVPNKEENEEEVKKAFDGKKFDFHKNYSKSGKYVSLTLVTEENSADDIINRYRSLEHIEGLVAL